jgi:hypothetical protein
MNYVSCQRLRTTSGGFQASTEVQCWCCVFRIYLTVLWKAHTIYFWMVGWVMSYELENMRKEATVAYFKVLSRHLPGETKENHENLNLDILTESDVHRPEQLSLSVLMLILLCLGDCTMYILMQTSHWRYQKPWQYSLRQYDDSSLKQDKC